MEGQRLRIVVGVDGSLHSIVALRWAVLQAERLDASVEVLHAWTGGRTEQSTRLRREAARQVLDDVVGDVLAPAGPDHPRVTTRLVEGESARVLVEAARGALFLVLGTHGRGKVARGLLGSVSTACVQSAQCPVTVVPTTPEEETEHVFGAPRRFRAAEPGETALWPPLTQPEHLIERHPPAQREGPESLTRPEHPTW